MNAYEGLKDNQRQINPGHALVTTDVSGIIKELNEEFLSLTGYTSPGELIGKNISILGSGKTGSSQYRNLWETILSGSPWTGILVNKRKDGSLYHDHTSIFPMTDMHGRITGFTALKEEAAKTLSISTVGKSLVDNPYAAIYQMAPNLPFVPWITDPSQADEVCNSFVITSANQALAQQYGFTAGDISGMKASEFFHHTWPQVKKFIAEMIQTGSSRFTFEDRKLDGTPIQVFGMYSGVFDTSSHLIGILCFQFDVNTSFSWETEKYQFLGRLSHELLTPLNSVMGFARLASGSDCLDSAREYLQRIQESSHELLFVIHDVLDSSAMNSGKTSFQNHPFSIPNMLQAIAEHFRTSASHRGIEVILQADPSLPPEVVGDRDRIRKTLLRMIHHTAKAGKDGCITVETRMLSRTGDRAVLQFSIAGRQPEYLADDSGEIQDELASISQMANAAGGEFHSPQASGMGSPLTFTVHLEGKFHTEDRSVASVDPSISGLSILAVEDNQQNQQLIGHILSEAGARVTIASSGEKCLRKMKRERFDAVLMDINLPGMDGYRTAQEIRNILGDVDIPIIALTANTLPGERQRCLKAGMNEYLPKPIDFELLFLVLSKLVSRKPPPAAVLNTKAALERLGNDEQLYRSILEKFLTNSPDQISQLEDEIHTGNWISSERSAHTMKSIAGYIGADRMYEICRRLEEESPLGRMQEVRRLFDDLQKEFQAVTEKISQYCSPGITEEKPKPELSKKELKQMCIELAALLKEYDLRAIEIFRTISGSKTDAALSECIDKLRPYMENYDFDEALKIIESCSRNCFS